MIYLSYFSVFDSLFCILQLYETLADQLTNIIVNAVSILCLFFAIVILVYNTIVRLNAKAHSSMDSDMLVKLKMHLFVSFHLLFLLY